MKAVVYARVSSKPQQDTGYSLPAQRKLANEYADRKSIDIAKIFSIAESASGKRERQVFAEMIEYMKKHDINNLLCEKVDRLTRNLKEAVTINEWLEQDKRRQVHFVKQNLVIHQNSKSDEKFRWDIEIVLAKKFIANLSEEVKKGQRAKIEAGWLPTKPPLGYKTIGEKGHKIHVVDEDVAPFIKKMFELYDTGNYSTRELGRKMFELGLRNRNSREVGKSRIYDLLSDPFYYGDMRWNGEIYRGKQEPLISKELFQSVQSKLNRKMSSPYFSKHNPVYKGKINCGECGRRVSWEKQKGTWYGGCKNCKAQLGSKKYIRQDEVDKEIMQKILEIAPKNDKILSILERALKEDHQKEIDLHKAQKTELERSLNQIDRKMALMYDDRLSERITPEVYDTNFKILKDQERDLLRQQKRLQEDKSAYYEAGYSIHLLASKAKDIYASKKVTTEERRLLLNYVFSNLSIKQGKLTPEYTEAFKFMQEWTPRLNASFELQKSVVNKGLNITFSIPRPVLLRGQDSNLRPTG